MKKSTKILAYVAGAVTVAVLGYLVYMYVIMDASQM